MDMTFPDTFAQPQRPKTVTVLGVLITAAAMISYLVAYAASDALVDANVLPRWSDGNDPRPRWLAVTFATLMTGSLIIAMCARWISQRQLRSIEQMERDD
jgi:hypothetical protein